MEYQNYEDYMRQVLGYSPQSPNIYEPYNQRSQQPYENTYYRDDMVAMQVSEDEINDLYPEIYRLVHPMVCKVCEANIEPITKELVDRMTDEVYMAIGDTEVASNIRVEAPKSENVQSSSDVRRTETRTERTPKRIEENRVSRTEKLAKQPIENRSTKMENNVNQLEQNRETISETRQIGRNSTLRDLIKILILQQLFGGYRLPHHRPPRPPFPVGPGMPPTRPPFHGGRPPMGNPPPRPREYTDYFRF